MNIWLVILIAGLITFSIRLSFILLIGRREVPEWLRRSLRFVPPAVLSVIAFQSLLFPAGKFDLSLTNTRLLAGLLAALVAWKTRSAMLTILAGMAILLLLQTLIR